MNDLPPLPPPDRTMHQYGKQIDHFTADQMRAYAHGALRAMPASRKDIEQAAFEKWLDKERPSGDVEQVQRQWEESSDYEEVQPAALMAEISHWHAIAQRHEVELRELRAQAASVEPVVLDAYDAGLLSDFGGGNVAWWWDYIRHELGAAHDFYQEQVSDLYAGAPPAPVSVPDVEAVKSLLSRIRPGVEAAPFVVEALQKIVSAQHPTPSPAQADAASEAFTGITNDDAFWTELTACLARATLTAKDRK